MAPDPSVVAAVAASVEAAPDNVALRLHLVELLLAADRSPEAVPHVVAALNERPADVDVLRLAVSAHERSGLDERAAGYRKLLDALTSTEGRPPDATPPPVEPDRPMAVRSGDGPSADGDDEEDEFDAFLREVLDESELDVERPVVTLDHVGGLAEVKRQLHISFLGPMRNPELRRTYGKSLRGGLLLYGPPGCGKTFLARAVAGELGASFFAVGLHDVLDMWLGNSERNVHAVFETARRSAPCVLFLDEVDALGLKRSNLSHSAGRNVVVQLLTEMDGSHDDNEGVFVLGATNQPWDLDPALRRPGRFDRTLLVLPPDAEARKVILEHHLADRPVSTDVDLGAIARRTEGYSGADLRLICEAAAEHGIAASIDSGQVEPITKRQLERATKEVKPSTRPWFETARNYATFANQDGAYDELLAYMRKHRMG